MSFGFTVAAISAYSSYSANRASNQAAGRAQENARRRYLLQSGVAKNQMEEQKMMALEKMTEVSRKFLEAKGRATVVQAETGVTGNVQKRLAGIQRTKESEVKGKVAKEIDTNVVNIAQDMLAKKIDTEAMIAEAEAKKKSSLTMLTEAGIAGAQGAMAGAEFSKSAKAGDFGVGVKNLFTK